MDPCTLSISGLTDMQADALTLMPACTLLRLPVSSCTGTPYLDLFEVSR
jgi:hypothetical protein